MMHADVAWLESLKKLEFKSQVRLLILRGAAIVHGPFPGLAISS